MAVFLLLADKLGIELLGSMLMGTADSTFDPNANGSVFSIATQSDGEILVGGSFSSIGGQIRNRIARLNADGTADSTFNPNANGSVFFNSTPI